MANLKGTPASKKEISWYSCIAAGHWIQIQKNETQKTRDVTRRKTHENSPPKEAIPTQNEDIISRNSL